MRSSLGQRTTVILFNSASHGQLSMESDSNVLFAGILQVFGEFSDEEVKR